jgi:hypothetical protein
MAQDHSAHHDHRMSMDENGMVMNANTGTLPRDCDSISADHHFEVHAGTEFAAAFPGTVFGYDQRQFDVEPCSRVRITFHNEDQVRHQWMVHGLPRYLYPGAMFHLEANGGHSVSGSFILPSDRRTYLVHCDITQHMEKGMKAQIRAGGGDGDLWAIPGVSRDFRRSDYLSAKAGRWLVVLALFIPGFMLLRRVIG